MTLITQIQKMVKKGDDLLRKEELVQMFGMEEDATREGEMFSSPARSAIVRANFSTR